MAQAAEENGNGTAEAADADAAHTKGSKRQKGASGEAMRSAPAEQSSRIHLSGHTQCVASVAWPSESSIVSGSWDHSVRALCQKLCSEFAAFRLILAFL